MFSFQVYPGNILNTYHWRAVDADHVVVWRGWYTIDGADSETVRTRLRRPDGGRSQQQAPSHRGAPASVSASP